MFEGAKASDDKGGVAVYCPRCDKAFLNEKGLSHSMADMRDHLKKAHPDYWEIYIEDED